MWHHRPQGRLQVIRCATHCWTLLPTPGGSRPRTGTRSSNVTVTRWRWGPAAAAGAGATRTVQVITTSLTCRRTCSDLSWPRRHGAPADVLLPPWLHLLPLQHLQQRLGRGDRLPGSRGGNLAGWACGARCDDLMRCQRASVTRERITTVTDQPTWSPAAMGRREGRRWDNPWTNGQWGLLIAQVGPTDQCTWEYSGHGTMLECGRSDEVLVGRWGKARMFNWWVYKVENSSISY